MALDCPGYEQAAKIVENIGDEALFYKVGLELYTAAGDALLRMLCDAGKQIFLDLKLFDIPNTVQRTCASIATKNVALTTIHTLGGRTMMKAARKGTDTELAGGAKSAKILGVTILTSLDEETLRNELYIPKSIPFMVRELALTARSCGLDGVVASGLELPLLRDYLGPDFIIVTPGIRPAGEAAQDQKRVLTPQQAFERGASYIVVGRPVVAADNPRDAMRRIIDQAGA